MVCCAVVCSDYVPPLGKGALYLRPLLMGSGPILGLGPAPTYTFAIYAAAVGSYFKVCELLTGGRRLEQEAYQQYRQHTPRFFSVFVCLESLTLEPVTAGAAGLGVVGVQQFRGVPVPGTPQLSTAPTTHHRASVHATLQPVFSLCCSVPEWPTDAH